MKRTSKFLSLLLALAMICSLFVPAMAADEKKEAPVPYAIGDVKGKLVILHTNDTHGKDLDVKGKTIGTAGIAQLKKDFEAAGAEVILMSAGDAIMGTPLVNDSKGATAIEFMNAAKYDVMTIGNHEMDYGAENLRTLAKAAKFPILGANVLDEKTGKSAFEANKVITTKSGLKVGVFGLATPETLTKADGSKMPGLTFLEKAELYTCAQAQVDELKKAGAEFIVCLGHLGVDEESAGNHSYDVCNNVTGIDLFVDGHSHSVMKDGKPVDEKAYPGFENKSKTLIVSTGTALANVGVVVYDKTAKTMKSELIAAANYTKVDAALAKTIAAADKKVSEKYSAVIGKTEVDLNGSKSGGKATSTAGTEVVFPKGEGNRTCETNLGDFAADAILWQARKVLGQDKVDASVTNGGGIRETLSKGNISKLDLFKVFPFGNVVSTITVTGAQLLEALEAATFCTPTVVGAFPQVSGIEFTLNTAVPYEQGAQYPRSTYYAPAAPGSRVTITSVNGKAWDAKANYVLATNDFTAAGGDTFGVFKTAGGWKSLGVPLEDALINYTTEVLKGTIPATYEKAAGRIKIDNLPLDITADLWSFDAVKYVVESQIMSGTGKGNFTPNGTITRGTIYQMLFNMEGKPTKDIKASAFTDIAGKWYADAANWAVSAKLLDDAGKTFKEEVITRGELATIIAKYAEYKGIKVATEGMAMKEMADYATISAEYLPGMTFCFYGKLMTGDQNKNLNPKGELTRAEMAQVMFNFSKLPAPAAAKAA